MFILSIYLFIYLFLLGGWGCVGVGVCVYVCVIGLVNILGNNKITKKHIKHAQTNNLHDPKQVGIPQIAQR